MLDVVAQGGRSARKPDDGLASTAHALSGWATRSGVALKHIQLGKPTQNAYAKCFNRICRIEVLDCCVFDSLAEVRSIIIDWMHRYNHHRPHETLGCIPPAEYRKKKFPVLCS